MAYSFLWGIKVSPIALSDLDQAFQETANGLFTTVSLTYAQGTLGFALQSALSNAGAALSLVGTYPSPAILSNLSQGKTGAINASQLLTGGANQQTFAQWFALVNQFMSTSNTSSGGSNAPVIANTPVLSGNAVVGSNLVAAYANATVTGNNPIAYSGQWFVQGANNPIAPATTIQSGNAALNFPVSGAFIGLFASFVETAKDTVTGLTATKSSVLSNVITGQTPVILSGAANQPGITPTGNQSATQVLTANTGNWNIATANLSFTWLFKDNGVAIGTRTASNTLVAGNTRIGHNITVDVQATSNLNVPSGIVLGNNAIFITGNVVVTNSNNPVVVGAANGSMVLDVTYNMTYANWMQGTGPAVVTKRIITFEQNGVFFATEQDTDPGAPFAICDSGNFNIGDQLELYETATIGGLTYNSGIVTYNVIAAPANLAVKVNPGSLTLTAGSSYTSGAPVTFQGGTTPYSIKYVPKIPGLTVNATTGVPTGTVGAVSTTNCVVTCNDSAGASVTANIVVTIQSAVSIAPVARLRADQPLGGQAGNLEAGAGNYPTINSISDALDNGWSYPGISTQVNGKVSRWCKTLDPAGSGKTVFFDATRFDDPVFDDGSGTSRRVDTHLNAWNGTQDGDNYYVAHRCYWPSANIDDTTRYIVAIDMHGSPDGNGWYLSFIGHNTGGQKIFFEVIRSDTDYDQWPIANSVPRDAWFNFLVQQRLDTTDTNCINNCWIGTSAGLTQVVNSNALNALAGQFPSYLKIANYMPGISQTPSWKYHADTLAVLDNSFQYTPAQIVGLLTGPNVA